jgi:hypothetical protein
MAHPLPADFHHAMRSFRLLAVVLSVVVVGACAGSGGPLPSPCTGHCETHEDGYQWAMQGTMTDPAPCESKAYSPDFVRGCKDAVNDYSGLRPASQGL